MTNKITIGLGLANLPQGVDTKEIEQFIANGGDGYDTYTLAPAPPGTARCAALEITLILGAVSSVITIAGCLWAAYNKFILPKKNRDQDDGGIYIGINKPDGTHVDFWIGNTHRDREVFIEEFTKKTTEICEEDAPDFWAANVTEIEKSGFWIRQK